MRYEASGSRHAARPVVVLTALLVAVVLLPIALAGSASAGTLERIREAAKLTLGYRLDARPFSYRDASGPRTGYSVELCQKVADEVKAELSLPTLAVEWVEVNPADRFIAIQQGRIDLSCGPDTVTLGRRKDVSFSIPIYAGGIGVVLRADAPAPLRAILAGQPTPHPVWRGSPAATILEEQTFSIVKGTTSESWVAERAREFDIKANVVPVDNYAAGIRRIVEGSSDVFFGDRVILLDAVRRDASAAELIVPDRLFTNEPLALGLARGDEDFRLVVDRTLSRLYRSGKFRDLYEKWFGETDDSTMNFFRQVAIPE